MMLMDQQARIASWYPSDRDGLRQVIAHDFGLDMEQSASLGDYAEAWAASRRGVIRHVPLYVLTPEMMEICLAAASTLSYDDVADYVQSEDHTHTAGHVLLPRDLLLDNPLSRTDVEDLRAFSWFPSHYGVRRLDGAMEPVDRIRQAPTLRVLQWAGMFDGLTPDTHQAFLTFAAEAGARLPPLAFSGEAWLLTDPDERAARSPGLENLDTSDREVVGTQALGEVVSDSDSSLVLRFLMAFWRLCDQEIATVTTQGAEAKSAKGGPRRSQIWEEVNVVALRRRRAPQDPERAPGAVEWSHRWVVQMHRVRQWYPSQGRHKVIFRGPFFKGPEGAPLKPTAEQVRSLAR